jgi:hypothetical protein
MAPIIELVGVTPAIGEDARTERAAHDCQPLRKDYLRTSRVRQVEDERVP